MLKKITFHLSVIAFVLINITDGLTQSSTSHQPFNSSYEVQKIPANPDVAQLGRFGDIPVNKYNGTANISIPIYEIDFDGLKIPIALRYNTGGVRVEQEASWVGLGWSLSDGMTITRDVNGYDDIYDEHNADPGYAEIKSIGWIYSKDYFKIVWPDELSGDRLSEPDLIDLQFRWSVNRIPMDTEPDFFTVTLPSGSCKFKLGRIDNETFLTGGAPFNNGNFKISYDPVSYAFKITDPNGFVFDFTVKELSTGFGSYESNDNYTKTGVVRGIKFPIFSGRHMITSWRISKITSPLGRVLDFTYEDGFYFSFPHFSENFDILYTNYPNFNPRVGGDQTLGTSVPMSANMTAFNVKNLSMISGDFGSVEFVLSDRSDLVSKQDKLALSALDPATAWNTYLIYGNTLIAKKVDQVIVRNKADEIVKSANLSYSYFNSQWVGVEPVYTATDPYQCDVSYIRLKLDGVDIGDQKYQFEYYQPDALPSKFSRSVDFWGFNNGINNNTKIPSFNRFYVNHPGFTQDDEYFEFFIKINGANRSADINYGKIGNLQKITYPTGGYTMLEYEGHKVTMSNVNYKPKEFLANGSGQLRFTDLDSSANYKYSYQYMKLAKTPSYSLEDFNTCTVSSSQTIPPDTNFEVTETSFCNFQNYNVRINGSISCSTGNCNDSYVNMSGKAIWIRNVNTGEEYVIANHENYPNQSPRNFNVTLNLPVGTYQLRTTTWTYSAYPLPTVVSSTSAYVTKYYSESILPTVNEEFEVGGSRINSVSNYDSDGSFISKSNYLYDQYAIENGKQVSNGKLMDELIFHSKAQNLFDYSAMDFSQNGNGCGAILSSDSKIRTNPSASGSHIGYSLVREEKVDALGNKLGQTVTEFANKANEYILKPDETLPKITLGAIGENDFHTDISDLFWMGIHSYGVSYGSVYILGAMPITYDYLNGSVLNDSLFNQENSLIRETTNVYNTFQVWAGTSVESTIVYYLDNSIIHFQPYLKIYAGERKQNLVQQLVSTTTTEYQNGIQLSSTTNNYYDNASPFLMTRSAITGSDGNLYTTKYYYPADLPTVPFMSALVTENQLTSPVMIERYKGSTANPYLSLLEKVQTFYNNTSGKVLPSEVFTYNLGNTVGQQRVLYEKYSGYGTLIQYRKNNENLPTTLIWSHNRLLPIAQVVNAQSDQVAFTSFDEFSVSDGGWSAGSLTISSAAKKTGNKCLDTGSNLQRNSLPAGDYIVGFWAKVITGSSGTVTINGTPITITDTDWKFHEVTKNGTTSISLSNSNVYIDELRLHPAGSQMTSYTYKPLTGMTTQTDPNGNVTYFEYDSNGRLMLIKDNEGNIVKKYSYNYKQSAAAE